ncbi:type II toxin-antitoxin system VapB family antitoxin [Sphingobium sp. EP60837]|uniref:type II toxin-antitoxin system VapB family antitoxin n=1 Tax=Sphingobium sp. EP60837 TaxID=1855519 RepID=UPI0007DDF3C5|nr:type II toxin-antitoxin system VapB family antitoxin [Sphingobium sp. EP60837]ANI78174.1 hypothetical protein EP837_01762 [Sphingobium sp. EP60837]
MGAQHCGNASNALVDHFSQSRLAAFVRSDADRVREGRKHEDPTDLQLHERNGEEPGKKYFVRTNIVIDDDLMIKVLRTTGFKTKREAVEGGLRLLLSLHSQAKLCNDRGKIAWEGDLDTMRIDR